MGSLDLASTAFLWMAAWQATFWLLLGAAASRVWYRQPARAHRLLLLTMGAALITPVLSLAVQDFGWGLLPTRPQAATVHSTASPSTPAEPAAGSAMRLEVPAAGSPRHRTAATRDASAAAAATQLPRQSAPAGWLDQLSAPAFLMGGWVFFSGIALLRLILSLRRARQLMARVQPVAHPDLQQALHEAAEKLGLSLTPALGTSDTLGYPVIWCWGRRPVLLVPHGACRTSSNIDWGSVFCHELAHWKRRDHLAGLLGELLVVTLPWHPLAWWTKRLLAHLSEQACDDWALTGDRSRADYAESLLNLHPQDRTGLALAAVSSRKRLAQRIRRILGAGSSNPSVGLRWGALAIVMTVILAAGIALAQTRPSSSVEVHPTAGPSQPETPEGTMVVTGRVLDADGKPVEGARVAVFANALRSVRRTWMPLSSEEVLGQVQSDGEGRFRLVVRQTSSAWDLGAKVIAYKPGHALGRQRLDREASEHVATVELGPEQIVRGRLVDGDGKPAAGVTVEVGGVREILPGVDTRYSFYQPPDGLLAWPKPATTDGDGRFALRGLGRNQEVRVQIKSERFARQWTTVETGGDQQEKDISLTLAPLQVIEGTVTHEDTGNPVLDAALIVFSRMSKYDNAYRGRVVGRTDENGRFRLIPYVGKYFEINVFPPETDRHLWVKKEMPWPEGAVTHQVDFALPAPRMVARGKVIEEGTGKPVAGARVEFNWRHRGNPFDRDEMDKEFESTVRRQKAASDSEGRFEIPVLPGPGQLLIKGPTLDYIHLETSYRELEYGEPGGQRLYPDALVALDLKPEDEVHEVTVALRRGVAVKGRVLAPDGKPVASAEMICRSIVPFTDCYSQNTLPVRDGRFELPGCDPQRTYDVYFLDAENQQGASVKLSAKQAGPVEVRLAPCGSAAARFIDEAGRPYAEKLLREPRPYIFMDLIVTPGAFAVGRADHEELVFDALIMDNLDGNRYRDLRTDEDGRVTFPTLIPGASYCLIAGEGGWKGKKDFRVEAARTTDLGEITIKRPK